MTRLIRLLPIPKPSAGFHDFEAFGKRLMPILAGAGIQLANPPDIFEVHNIVKG